MDATSFPAAIAASWLIVIAISAGRWLGRFQDENGREHWLTTVFIFSCIAITGGLWAFEAHSPFVYNLISDITGALIGLGTAHFALRLVSVLRRARRRKRGAHPPNF